MANGKRPAEDRMQVTRGHPKIDLSLAEPECIELPPGYHPVLPLRKPSDRMPPGSGAPFPLHR